MRRLEARGRTYWLCRFVLSRNIRCCLFVRGRSRKKAEQIAHSSDRSRMVIIATDGSIRPSEDWRRTIREGLSAHDAAELAALLNDAVTWSRREE